MVTLLPTAAISVKEPLSHPYPGPSTLPMGSCPKAGLEVGYGTGIWGM